MSMLLAAAPPVAAFPSTLLRFNFSETRVSGGMIQLQEIRLYDEQGHLIDLEGRGAHAYNWDGSSPNNQPADHVIDADVTACLCQYGNYEAPNFLPALYCLPCEEYTQGKKWLDFNTLMPCNETAVEGVICTHEGGGRYFALIDIVLPEPIDVTA